MRDENTPHGHVRRDSDLATYPQVFQLKDDTCKPPVKFRSGFQPTLPQGLGTACTYITALSSELDLASYHAVSSLDAALRRFSLTVQLFAMRGYFGESTEESHFLYLSRPAVAFKEMSRPSRLERNTPRPRVVIRPDRHQIPVLHTR